MSPMNPERFADEALAFDADGDGKLDRAELIKFAQSRPTRPFPGGPPGPGGPGGPGRPGDAQRPGRPGDDRPPERPRRPDGE